VRLQNSTSRALRTRKKNSVSKRNAVFVLVEFIFGQLDNVVASVGVTALGRGAIRFSVARGKSAYRQNKDECK
jgi:hypothetical protein